MVGRGHRLTTLYPSGRDPELPADVDIKMTTPMMYSTQGLRGDNNHQIARHIVFTCHMLLSNSFPSRDEFITVRIAKQCIIGFQSERQSSHDNCAIRYISWPVAVRNESSCDGESSQVVLSTHLPGTASWDHLLSRQRGCSGSRSAQNTYKVIRVAPQSSRRTL